MPTFAVDWDGTCVHNKYPEQGDWLPGAVDALHTLDRLGVVLIYSVRIAPVAPFTEGKSIPAAGSETPFVNGEWQREVAYIRGMLDAAGLPHVEIWQRNYKPPAAVYIDDKAIRFTGNWEATLDEALDAIQPKVNA